MNQLVYESYKTAVALAQVPDELKRSLDPSGRVPGFLARLDHEIARLPHHLRTRENIIMLVTDLTTQFLKLIQRKAEERMLADAAKTAMIRNNDKLERAKAAVESGIITEEVLEDG